MFHLLRFSARVFQKDLPILIGYTVLGLACGMLGQKAGLMPATLFAMSVLVYGGSSQFIGIAMMMDGASLLSIFLTVFVTSLRNALFTSTLAPYVRKKSGLFTTLFAYGLTDECFAVNLAAFEGNADWSPEEAQTINLISMLVWSLSSALGCYLGSFLHLNLALVSYILTTMFLGIWSNYMGSRALVTAGIASGLISVFFSTFVPFKLHIVLASLTASIFLTILTRKKEARHE